MMKTIAAIVGALALSACTTSAVYQPANGSNFGYSDQKIEDDRYRVSYNGAPSTPRATVENYLLYRMSEITLAQGYDYFRVLDTDTECHTQYIETGPDEPCSYYQSYGARFPYHGYGYYCDPSNHIYESKRYEAVAFVSLHHGEKPSDDSYAFSALAVSQNLASQIVRTPN